MEAWELGGKLRKKLGIDSVWDSKEFLCLNENGKPTLEMWYKAGREEVFKYLYFEYVNDEWIEIKESEVNE